MTVLDSAGARAPPIRILVLEDNPDDAELELTQLERDGLACESRRVQSCGEYVAALTEFRPQVILADNKLPAFDGRTAIALAMERSPDVPVIVVSGTLGDEGAAELIRLGARDFVLKDRLGRLGSAVRTALADAAERSQRQLAERQLRESEERFRALVENTSDIIAVGALDGTLRYVSPAVKAIGGYEPAELIGRSYFDLIYREDLPLAARQLAELVKHPGEPARFELRYRARDGSPLTMEYVVRNLAGVPGVDGLVVNMRDITERKRLADTLAASEAKLREIVENATNLFYSHTPNHVLTYMSPQSRTILECEPEEALKDWTRFLTDNPINQGAIESTQRAIDTGRRQPPYEVELVGKRGRKVWGLVSESPVVRDGKTVAIVGALTDITEQRAAMRRLQLANALIEQSPAVLFRWAASAGWPVVYVSENVRQWGYEPEELLSGRKPFAELIHAEDQRRIADEVAAHSAGGIAQFEQEYRIVKRDGEVIWVDDRTTVERDAAGAPVFFQGVVTDITKRKAEEALARAGLARSLVQAEALAQISVSESLAAGDFEALARQITELAARVAGAERANVWLFNEAENELRCIDAFEATPSRHSAGPILREEQFRNEFAALKSAPYVDADDPLTDPRTAGYIEGYLRPLGITSMLDCVVQAPGRHLGLLCIEHVGKAHHWEGDEIVFGCRLADKIGLCIANGKGRAAEERVRAQLDELQHWQALNLDREGRVLELKREVNQALARMGAPPRYRSAG